MIKMTKYCTNNKRCIISFTDQHSYQNQMKECRGHYDLTVLSNEMSHTHTTH